VTTDSLFNRVIGRLKTLKGAIVAIAGVGAVLGGLAGYWNAYQAARSSTQSSAQLLALVGKGDAGPLSIVVLPFTNLTGDPQQAYVADGITAAVTADLSRIRDAFIVSTATVFAYKDKPVTLQQIGKELGVRFALQGGVQRSGDKIRINAQLADTTNNAQLWSESFDGSQGDLFALQEIVTARIGNSIGREMVVFAAREVEARKAGPTVTDLLLRVRALSLKPVTKEIYAQEQALLRQALALDPGNAGAMAGLASSLVAQAYNRSLDDPAVGEKQLDEGRALAEKAKDLDPSNLVAHSALGMYAATRGDHEEARRSAEVALSLRPKDPMRYSSLADDHLMAGEPPSAVELLAQAIKLDPRDPHEFVLFNMGAAHFMLGNDKVAISWLLKVLGKNPTLTDTYALLAMAYARLGDQARSRSSVAELLRRDPRYQLSSFEIRKVDAFPPVYATYWAKRLMPAWRLAGLPE
jgi:TolB-like protein/cytochrome c-type biogenesis protein CcmH/NrfG